MALQEVGLVGKTFDSDFGGAPKLQFNVPLDQEANSIILSSRKATDDSVLVAQLDFYDSSNDDIDDQFDQILAELDEAMKSCDVPIGDPDPNFQFSFFEGQHTKFRFNDAVKVTEFHYLDMSGKPFASFMDIRWSDDCKVTSFRDIQGNTWFRMPADPSSPTDYVRDGKGWFSIGPTGQPTGDTRNLGDLTFDEKGMDRANLPKFVADGF